jgi:hypothetical protein
VTFDTDFGNRAGSGEGEAGAQAVAPSATFAVQSVLAEAIGAGGVTV